MSTNTLTDFSVNNAARCLTKVPITTYYKTAGTYTYTPTTSGVVVMKIWGAGGSNSLSISQSAGNGGGGGYSTITFNATVGDVYYILVGYVGTYTNSSFGTAFQGGYNTGTAVGGTGGGGSAVAKFAAGTYTLLAVAGGGGGAAWTFLSGILSSGGGGGAGGGAAGGTGGANSNSSGGVGGTGGGGGAGGAGTTSTGFAGSVATNSAATLSGFGGAGSIGGGQAGGCGGGGYGGGGGGGTWTNGSNVYGAGGGGGGGYFNAGQVTSGSTTAASGVTPPNTADANYIAAGTNAGVGNTGNGLVVALLTPSTTYINYNTVGPLTLTDTLSPLFTSTTMLNATYIPNATINSGSAVTAAAASSLYIAGPPAAGANYTITAPYAMTINSGKTLLKDPTNSANSNTGALVLGGGIGMGGGGTGAAPIINWGSNYNASALPPGKQIALYDFTNSATDFQFYGFGVSSSQLNYVVPGTTSHVFHSASGSSSVVELMRVTGGATAAAGLVTLSSPLSCGRATVTQTGSNTTSVTINSGSGKITMAAALAAGAAATFTVNNTFCTASSIVLVSTGQATLPLDGGTAMMVWSGNAGAGSFSVEVFNSLATNASRPAVINFLIC